MELLFEAVTKKFFMGSAAFLLLWKKCFKWKEKKEGKLCCKFFASIDPREKKMQQQQKRFLLALKLRLKLTGLVCNVSNGDRMEILN